jgi:hypothetical protein
MEVVEATRLGVAFIAQREEEERYLLYSKLLVCIIVERRPIALEGEERRTIIGVFECRWLVLPHTRIKGSV